MRSSLYAALAAVAATKVAAHSLFQALWVDGVDMISLELSLPAGVKLTYLLARRPMCSYAWV